MRVRSDRGAFSEGDLRQALVDYLQGGGGFEVVRVDQAFNALLHDTELFEAILQEIRRRGKR